MTVAMSIMYSMALVDNVYNRTAISHDTTVYIDHIAICISQVIGSLYILSTTSVIAINQVTNILLGRSDCNSYQPSYSGTWKLGTPKGL